MADILFGTIERMHGTRLWGRFLDAGTGLHSMKWVQNLQTSSWTAITADNQMKQQIIQDTSVSSRLRPNDHILVGNWMDEHFCSTLGKYDTILADYLIGAVDGFSPYEQDNIIRKLKQHLLPNGRLYFIGMNPIPDEPTSPACIISEIRRARDACILLAGHRPYREFPSSWMQRHIEGTGLHFLEMKSFTILHSEESALRQLRVGRSKLDFILDKNLRDGMDKYLIDLEIRIKNTFRSTSGARIPLSFDYVIGTENTVTEEVDDATLAAPSCTIIHPEV